MLQKKKRNIEKRNNMKLINQSYEICKTHGYTLQDVYKDIERAARVSYKSEDKITEDSAEKMVQRLINMKHYSPLEFGTIYLKTSDYYIINKYIFNPYSKVEMSAGVGYITTNYRVIIEKNRIDDLQYMCEPTEHHQKRTTVKFITNRAVSHELVRHRSMSFMQESQRYVSSCNKRYISEYNCDNVDDIISAYTSGFSMREISNNSCFTEWQIRCILKENNIQIRGLGCKGIIDNNYFKQIDTSEKAYLLGIIQTDGSIVNKPGHKSVHITQHKDYSWYIKDMLLQIKDKITCSPDNNCTHLQFGSNDIVDDLVSIGIIPNKTYDQSSEDIDKLWNSIPEEYKPDFIRGLIDGDGWVRYFIQKRGVNESCNIGFCSHNQHIVDILIDYIDKKYSYKCTKQYDGSTFRFNISDYNKSIEIGKDLYKHFKYPFGHPKKAATWIKRIGDTYPYASYKDLKFQMVIPAFDLSPIEKFTYLSTLDNIEDTYTSFRLLGFKPQQARTVLPNATKTELYMCGFDKDWEHFFDLRDKTNVDPQMYNLAHPLHEEFNKIKHEKISE